MNKKIKKEKTKKNIKISTTVAAAFIVVFGVTLNASPALAFALSDVPVINSIVKVITFGKYVEKDNGYELSVNTPKLEGLVNEELQNKLNEEFKAQGEEVKELFEKDAADLKKEFGDETVHMGIEFNYDVKTDNNDILALDVYTFYASGSSTSIHKYYTLNKHTSELYTLKGMFKDGTDYVTPISDYIRSEMERKNAEEDGLFFLEDFDKIAEDQNFYINNDGDIVICFGKYDIAAGAQGTPEFAIPHSLIANILTE
ncbi:MAG: DUF3298 domain-containing protein [Candidatus Metalachnospira sp.]|nr:DUF3298 domain-containing protein [Candidatus Metalachnospira sp.]